MSVPWFLTLAGAVFAWGYALGFARYLWQKRQRMAAVGAVVPVALGAAIMVFVLFT